MFYSLALPIFGHDMSDFDKIKAPIAKEMDSFESYFRNAVKTPVPLLDIITHYVLRRKGKQMRPMFVFLSSQINGGTNESSFVAATMIELLHTATLIHDDIVDDTHERRGFFSINALWKNKIAVLVGDYFLSRGLLISMKHKRYDLLEIISETVKEMSEGELLQIEKARKLNVTEEIYFEIIKKKTATLISACTATGAKAVCDDEEKVAKMKLFGELVGIAFQIRDDIFDYEQKGLIGKPVGNDLKEKKMTLPLIHVLGKVSASEVKRIKSVIKNHNNDRKKVNEVIAFVRENGGIEYSMQVMQDYKNKALQLLNDFPESESKAALKLLVEYSINRNK